ncbi:MAG: prepilin-type N-terminal cleavage/methylation domain-containing protein, partial [Planctomycetota bacterium]|nr:prepilin-type N-terminal cleavage/methylation domain-containing protein [Planctomycetota bacterium]
MKARGFTILEVLIASSLFAVMFGIAVTAVAQDSSTHRTLDAHFGPELRSRKALEFMTTELRMAGIRGEDRNGNGILDANEDVNENLEFDA